MATEISAVISWHEVLHPDIGDRGKCNFPWHGTAGQCWERFVADGDTAGVSARRVISPTATAQHHSQATYLADGALGVKATRGSTNNENYVTQAVLGYFIFKTSHISCIGSHFYSIQIALKIPHIWCYMHYPLERIA